MLVISSRKFSLRLFLTYSLEKSFSVGWQPRGHEEMTMLYKTHHKKNRETFDRSWLCRRLTLFPLRSSRETVSSSNSRSKNIFHGRNFIDRSKFVIFQMSFSFKSKHWLSSYNNWAVYIGCSRRSTYPNSWNLLICLQLKNVCNYFRILKLTMQAK